MTFFKIDQSFCWDIVLSLGHSIWLGIVIVSFAMLGNYLLRARSANSRYWLNLVALATFAISLPAVWLISGAGTNGQQFPKLATTPPIASTKMDGPVAKMLEVADNGPAIPQTPAIIDSRPIEGHFQSSPSATLPAWVTRMIAAGYLVGVCYMLIRLSLAVRRSQKLLEGATLVSDASLLRKVEQVSHMFSLRTQPVLAVSENVVVPVAVGLFRPAVLLPASIVSGLSTAEIEFVLRHELAHLCRYDQFVIVLQRVMESLVFYHPATWYLSRRINEERENCCDDLACEGSASRLDYANVLVRVAEIASFSQESHSGDSVALAADGHRPSLLHRRISRLLIPATASPATGPKVVLCLLIMVSMSAALLAGHAMVARDVGDVELADPVEANDDAKSELIDLVKKSRASVDALRTAHIQFKHTRVPMKLDISREQCFALIEEIGPIDNEERLNLLLTRMAKGKPFKKLSFVDAELHFDTDRTRETIGSAHGNSVHITDKELSMRWDPANYQLDVQSIKKNRYFQLTRGHFLRSMLPSREDQFYSAAVDKLKNFNVTRVDGDLAVEHPEKKGRMLISGESGFPICRESGRPDGSITYRGGWKQYRGVTWFPDVSFEMRFEDGKFSYIAAQVVKSARINIDLPEHLFVMSAPAGTNLIWKGQHFGEINEDVFDVRSEPEIKEATRSRKREFTPEEKRGAEAASELYSLKESEVFKRLGPPFPLAQKYTLQMLGQVPDGRRPQQTTSWILNYWEDGSFQSNHVFTGGTFNIQAISEQVFELHPSAIEGDEDLLNRELPGDFVVRVGADRTEVANALKRVIEAEIQVGVDVKFEKVMRPVYVANGTLELDPGRRDLVAVHSGSKPNQFPEIVQRGNVELFLNSFSEYINQNVKMGEVIGGEQEFKWSEAMYGNERKPKEERFKFDVQKVIEIVETQTGLKFEKQEAEKTVLVIRKQIN